MRTITLMACFLLSACGQIPPEAPCTNWTGGPVGIWTPTTPNGKNVILQQGHDSFNGCADPAADMRPVVQKLTAAGFTVYGMEMPPLPHANRPLSDFTDPVYKLLDQIGPSYMIGLSGGGWTTTVVTANDARVIKGYSVAGDAPLEVWGAGVPDQGRDYEQFLTDYWTLYSQAGARLMHIYNATDSCCFAPITGDVGYPYIAVNDNGGRHEVSNNALEYIISDMSANY